MTERTTENWFDEPVAAHYDDDVAAISTPEALGPTIDVLVALAGEGAALELAIGTGRVALPLHARGVPVHGIELSEAMLARLAAKPGAAGIVAVQGDMAITRVPGSFALVYLLFNTIENLTTQDAQVACFENAAAHLAPGGTFVVETGVPNLQGLPRGERFRPFDVSDDHLGFDEYDIARQRSVSHHWSRRVTDHGQTWERFSVPFRYVWPSELDLMARLAGMSLRSRWADWDGSTFTSESRKHVSVWEKPAGRGTMDP